MRLSAVVLMVAWTWTTGERVQQTPTFRNRVELAVVDLLATSPDGTPVGGLTASELRLTIDGKPREIESLQFVNTGGTAAPRNSTLPAAAPAFTDGRRFVVVVNHESIAPGQERPVIDAATRFVARLGANDEVAVVTLPRGRIESNFTRLRAQTVAALRRVSGHAPPMRDVRCADVKALRTFADGLRLDTLASLVLVSEEVSNADTDPQCRGDFEDLVRMLNRRQTRVFAIRPAPQQNTAMRSASVTPDSPRDLPGLSALATMTGGQYFAPSGMVDPVFETIDRTTSAYYLLAFAPTDKELKGSPHTINVTTTHPGTTIRSRFEFQIGK